MRTQPGAPKARVVVNQTPRETQRKREDEATARVFGGALGGLLLGAAVVGGGPALVIGGVVGAILAAARNAELDEGEKRKK